MQNASYFVSYSIFFTCQADKAYARYQAEQPDGDKANEHYKVSQKKYKRAKQMLKELECKFNILLKYGELKKLIKKAQKKGKKELTEIQKYVKKELKEGGVL
ncbi:hypothetical protein [Sporomusa sphaeroides]|uniref:Uncharacterized protein n=1 Tax=Sporomusa sphaeroides DSM 2875 TaxID=1337886 RepID=A0ABM9W604_9FIRM|nr:hypothetical protein [Sporomusa sphaeroides]OLS57717.1 hypothetical protein SPSPH_12450 [Sporomusa sphaeroides DSM 2875]CVK20586.1 hypothetical protein SSPH_03254 [Sporomusa sphaeroides DSM 2875]